MSVSSSTSTAMAGNLVTLTCSVALPDGVTGSPLLQWEGPGGILQHSANSSGQEVISNLTLSAIRTTQAGQFTCTASLSDFIESDTTSIAVQSEYVFTYYQYIVCIHVPI